MNKREQKITTEIKKYLQAKSTYGSCAIEVKQSQTSLLNYKQNITDKIHQVAALKIAKHRRLVYKIADTSLSQLPFDMFCLENVPAFYAISFKYPEDKTVYLIDVDRIEEEILLGSKKSLSRERANEISFDKITIA